MDVSVIIVNYKTPQLVVDCINSIFEKTYDLAYEIIVVDNDSQDNSEEIICGIFNEKILYIQSKSNLGFGKANNLGAKYASGEYLFLLNSDTLLMNNAIKELYDYISNNKECGIVGGNLYTIDMIPNPSFSLTFNSLEQVKKDTKWFNILKERLDRRLDKSKVKTMVFNNTTKPLEVAYIFGADMMISKDLYNQINGFDDDFFMYYEEQELSYRINQLGYQSICIPNSQIIHYDGVSTKKENTFSSRQYRMRIAGSLVYYFKRYGINGVKEYYRYKIIHFNREIFISKTFKKINSLSILNLQLECFKEEYENFMNKYLKEVK